MFIGNSALISCVPQFYHKGNCVERPSSSLNLIFRFRFATSSCLLSRFLLDSKAAVITASNENTARNENLFSEPMYRFHVTGGSVGSSDSADWTNDRVSNVEDSTATNVGGKGINRSTKCVSIGTQWVACPSIADSTGHRKKNCPLTELAYPSGYLSGTATQSLCAVPFGTAIFTDRRYSNRHSISTHSLGPRRKSTVAHAYSATSSRRKWIWQLVSVKKTS